MQYISEASELF